MDPIALLSREDLTDITREEEDMLARELSAAYHMDEAAATSLDIQRIADRVRCRLKEQAGE